VLWASLNTTQRSKTATVSSGPKVGLPSTETQHHWYHFIDKKYYFLHVKFEVRFVISFMIKSMSTKKWQFSWGMVHAFFWKNDFLKIRQLSSVLNWRMPGTHSACVNRAQKCKKVKLEHDIRSFIHLTQGEVWLVPRQCGVWNPIGGVQIHPCVQSNVKKFIPRFAWTKASKVLPPS
jgi:hypothetical protein